MSTPVGQSDAQPCRPGRGRAPRAPRVRQTGDERTVQRLPAAPGAAAGGVLLLAGRGGGASRPRSAGTLATPAAVHRVGERIAGRGRAGRRSASSGRGSTMLPGLSRLRGSHTALTAAKRASDSSSYITDSSSSGPGRRRAPGERAPICRELDRAGGEEPRKDARGRRTGSRCARARTCRRSARRGRRRGRAPSGAGRSRATRRRRSGGTAASSHPEYAGRASDRAASPAPSRDPPQAAASGPSATTRWPSAPASATTRGTRARRRRPRRRATRHHGEVRDRTTAGADQVDDPARRALAGDHPAAGRRDQGGYGVGGVHHRG